MKYKLTFLNVISGSILLFFLLYMILYAKYISLAQDFNPKYLILFFLIGPLGLIVDFLINKFLTKVKLIIFLQISIVILQLLTLYELLFGF